MTTDPFTTAARAEAESRWPTYAAVGFSGAEDRQVAFRWGAEWAREYLAAQEETDAEVEAAARAIWATRYPESRPDIAEATWAEMTAPDDWMPEALDIAEEARAALSAARRARGEDPTR